MSAKKDQQQADDMDQQTAFELVRPGLATEDRGDIGEPVPEDLGQRMARIAAGGDSSATSSEIKKAKLQLPAWKRQEQVLEAFSALGNDLVDLIPGSTVGKLAKFRESVTGRGRIECRLYPVLGRECGI